MVAYQLFGQSNTVAKRLRRGLQQQIKGEISNGFVK